MLGINGSGVLFGDCRGLPGQVRQVAVTQIEIPGPSRLFTNIFISPPPPQLTYFSYMPVAVWNLLLSVIFFYSCILEQYIRRLKNASGAAALIVVDAYLILVCMDVR